MALWNLRRAGVCLCLVMAGLVLGCDASRTAAVNSAAQGAARSALRGDKAALWGQAGSVAYPAAATTMRLRATSPGAFMPDFAKERLRPRFGSLVDEVRLHYGVTPVEQWVEGGIGIRLSDVDAKAQTYGRDIYFKASEEEATADKDRFAALVAHELVHTLQYEEAGGTLSAFGERYFRAHYMAGKNYRDNPMEQEAYRVQGEIRGEGG